MTETDPRSDVYTLVAFLAELDRVLHPLLRGARGRVRLGPTFPPPLPSFDGPTSPPGGSSAPRTPGPGSRRSAPRAAGWGASPEASAPRFPRVERPASPALRTEPALQASSVSGPALPSRRAEAEAVLPPGAELPETPGEPPRDPRNLPVPLTRGDRLAVPTRSRAPGLAGSAAPQLLDRGAVRAAPAPTPLVSTPSVPNAGEPHSTAAPPRLPPPQGTASA
ncbi:MAG TPA: hypothetical protein VFU02_18905, partial [Polyangiaceae bacterium]|nr:hypothetical protein [Polyangiaceae bacterium]